MDSEKDSEQHKKRKRIDGIDDNTTHREKHEEEGSESIQINENDHYDPKSKELGLTWCERLVIAVGTVIFVTLMVLMHHPEIYSGKILSPGDSLILNTNRTPQLITGFATIKATAEFATAQKKKYGLLDSSYHTDYSMLSLSAIGIGSYLGESTDQVDTLMSDAVYNSVKNGINVIDTSINYRGMKSEKAIGAAITKLILTGVATRSSLFVSTKAGFIPAGNLNQYKHSFVQCFLQWWF